MSTYQSILAPELGRGFSYGEIVAGSRTHALPPPYMRPRLVPTLALANRLRAAMLARGARGLRIQAAYRPKGGAALSMHKFNRALDLDLLEADDIPEMRLAYYEEGVRLWIAACSEGLEVGLGLYCPRDVCAGRRIHLDVGYRTRTWQHGWAAGAPDAKLIAARLGLALPSGVRPAA